MICMDKDCANSKYAALCIIYVRTYKPWGLVSKLPSLKHEVPRHSARYFAHWFGVLKALGVDVDTVKRRASAAALEIDAGVTIAQYDALVRECARASGRDDLGFLLGREVQLTGHEILGFGILTSPTLDYALSLAARYYRLVNPWVQFSYRRGPQRSEVTMQPRVELPPTALRFLLEVCAVSAHVQVKSQLGSRIVPYDVHVSYAQPPYFERYRELAPARFHFADGTLPGVRIVMDTAMVAQPIPMANRSALKMAEARCEDQLRKVTQFSGMTSWVTMMLREANDALPSREDLARLLNQSPRTLDRQLTREGSKFLDIAKRVRHEKACTLLASGLSATQVAYQVGYGDVANFTRAFRRESGKTPGAYARSHRG
jgi:AraC-like DNA-binding protein